MFRKIVFCVFCVAAQGKAQEEVFWKDMYAYLEERNNAVVLNQNFSFDQAVSLSPQEVEVNVYFNRLKKKLLLEYQQKDSFPPAKNFLLQKKQIEDNRLFQWLQKMPKGGLLHLHSSSLLHTKCLIEELTRLPNCHIYWKEGGPILKGTLHFYEKDHAPEGFIPLEDLRKIVENCDEMLFSLLALQAEDLTSAFLWVKLEQWFTRISGLIHYRPAFIKYYKKAIETLIEDGIDYMELRALLNVPLYHLDGTKEDALGGIKAYLQVKEEIQEKYPHFDFKLIFTEFRNMHKSRSMDLLEQAYFLRSLYPKFIIGYDLVGEEDTGRTTLDYVETLIKGKAFEEKYQIDMPYYFHDGESTWTTNNNLYDAVLLHSLRIGHGLNLYLYPYLVEKVKKEKICIEVCPISNQVLGYIPDLRIHPASRYLKEGIPCVLSSDDPGLFGYHGMTHDLWEAVMAWDLDVKALKALCINSLVYSGMDQEERSKALDIWQEKWDRFIEIIGEQCQGGL